MKSASETKFRVPVGGRGWVWTLQGEEMRLSTAPKEGGEGALIIGRYRGAHQILLSSFPHVSTMAGFLLGSMGCALAMAPLMCGPKRR